MDELAVETIDPVSEPSKLEDEALYSTLRGWFIADADHSAEWRRTAKEEFGFAAGDQWDPKDKSALDEAKRPVITFNRCISIIKAVAGVEINGRHDTVFLPRQGTAGQVKANEILTSASQWMADSCDAEDEQSEAFQDVLNCGMGWTELRVAYDEEPDGKYIEAKVDPLEMYWDRSARSKNLQDARRVFRVRKMSLDEARDLARSIGAEAFDDELNAQWAVGAETDSAKPVEDRRLRIENSGRFDPKSEVYIVHAQWIEREPVFRVADPVTGKELTLTQEKFDQYSAITKQHAIKFQHVQQTRKVYKQAFLGGKILGQVTECPGKDRFTFQCITGERDRNKGTWFGLVRLMRDPQMWANKWLSQTLHILNTTAKGGIIAEADAFKDQREAQETYAQADAITWAAKDAIQKGKIMQKPGVGVPTAYVNLLEFAISSIRDVTGINLELLGMRDANQPGILEAQRKQAAMTILATMFDSLRRYRKNVGRVRLHFIQEYFADGRLIRIAGPDGQMLVPLLKQDVLGDFEVIIEDAPTSPNQKQETWGLIQQVMPVFKEMLTPESVVAILEYSPLPSKLVETFKQLAMQAQKQQAPQRQMQEQIAVAGKKSEIDKNAAAAEKDRATAEATRAKSVLDMAMAGAEAARANLGNAVANVMSPQPWQMPQMAESFVVDPMQGQRQLPQLPVLPTVGEQPRQAQPPQSA